MDKTTRQAICAWHNVIESLESDGYTKQGKECSSTMYPYARQMFLRHQNKNWVVVELDTLDDSVEVRKNGKRVKYIRFK